MDYAPTFGDVVDFTSALYLGLQHPSRTLPPWAALTLGRPAALQEPCGAVATAVRTAALQGRPAGVLGASTLHLMWDLVGLLAADGRPVVIDAGAYAIARWAAERACAHQGPVVEFAHHDPDAARRAVRRLAARRPVILVDGFCPDCGAVAPVDALNQIAAEHDGWLVCDDTQAIGILGRHPSAEQPYGYGGSGVLAFTGTPGSHTVLVSSLAKAFGAPIAILSGPRSLVRWFEERSETRVHCSPPTAAAIAAASHALAVNARAGDGLRAALVARVAQFRRELGTAGVPMATSSPFPVQSIGPLDRQRADAIERALASNGVRAVIRRGRCRSGTFVTFLIGAEHTPSEIRMATRLVAALLAAGPGLTVIARR